MKIKKMKSLMEAEEEMVFYYDQDSGKTYTIENGKFVEFTPQKGGGGDDNPPPPPKKPDDDDKPQMPPRAFDREWAEEQEKQEKRNNSPYKQVEGLLREIEILKERINDIDGSYDEDVFGEKDLVNDLSDEILNSASDLNEEVNKLKKEIEKLRKELKDKGGVAPDDIEEIKQKEEDIKNIKDALDDVNAADEIMRETKKKVYSSRQQKLAGERAAKAASKSASASDADVINLLKASLSHTLKAEIKEMREETWSKFNKKAHAAGLLAPGVRREEKVSIPTLNVYFDRSNSWGPEKSIFGQNAVDSISYMAKKGLLKLRLYYFNDRVMETDPGYGSGWTPYEPVAQHIRDTKPDNVLIMTDADFDRQGAMDAPPITVKGAVWQLFKGQKSQYLPDKLKGRKMTKVFFIR